MNESEVKERLQAVMEMKAGTNVEAMDEILKNSFKADSALTQSATY